jgi:hypothetical protein
MRRLFNLQLELGGTPIEDIVFNARSRDNIPQLLRGLHYIYTKPSTRESVFGELHNKIGPDVSFENGRPGDSGRERTDCIKTKAANWMLCASRLASQKSLIKCVT